MVKQRKVHSVKWWARVVALTILGILVLKGLSRWLLPDPAAEDAAGYVMPGEVTRDYSGAKALRLNFYLLRHRFSDQPPMVHAAYSFIEFCAVNIFLMLVVLFVFLRLRQKNADYARELRDLYHDKLREVLATPEPLTTGQIDNLLNPKKRYLQIEAFASWLTLLKEIHDEARQGSPAQPLSQHNMKGLFRCLGLDEYFEDVLLNGVPGKQYLAIEYLRLLRLEVPTSLVTRLLTDRHDRLRKAAKQYYMTLDTEDPYATISTGHLHSRFSDWDGIVLHDTIKRNVEQGKDIPPFRSHIENTHDPALKRHLIEEAGYWVDEENMNYLLSYLGDSRIEFRNSIYRSIAHNRYAAAEPRMLANYPNETVDMKIRIVETLVACRSGRQDDFLLQAYGESTSRKLKRTLLRAMTTYSDASRANFDRLRATAAAEDAVMFDHVLNH